MRLGVDAGNFPRDRRGLGRYARSVLRVAREDPAIEIELLSLRQRDDAALRAEFDPLPVVPARTALQPGRYDVVWCPWNGIRFGTAAPAFVMIADAFAFDEPHRDPFARRREQAPIRRAGREAAALVTISQWSRARVAGALRIDPRRLTIIPLAPDPFFVPGDALALPSELVGARFVLLVGARERRKNARTAIEACARAFSGAGERLVVAGTLADDDLRLAEHLGVELDEFEADDATLRALYRSAAVVVVPSSAEGFGLVAVEALACGARVLAADAAALPEATQGLATLIDAFDVGAWAGAIRGLLDHPALAMTQRARAVAHFAAADRALPARRTLALLRRLAETGSTGELADDRTQSGDEASR